MSDSNTIKLRIKFSKHGTVRYIGHLDVMRYFQKCFRRAEIDIAYSQGFSPHQIMSFAQPLSVGHESNGEYLDVELHSLTSCEEVVQRLNNAGIDDIKVLSAGILPDKALNAMASVAAARYTVTFKKQSPFKTNITDLVSDLLSKDEVFITKSGKNGDRQVNIRPGIYELTWDENHNCFSMLLDASSAGNIKPIQVVDALLAMEDSKGYDNMLFVVREDTYLNANEKNSKPSFLPLDSICISHS